MTVHDLQDLLADIIAARPEAQTYQITYKKRGETVWTNEVDIGGERIPPVQYQDVLYTYHQGH
jgi:hypothetical protein